MLVTQTQLQTTDDIRKKCTSSINDFSFVSIKGENLLNAINISKEQLNQFSAHWSNLVIDHYMSDGGGYRYRRYGQMEVDSNSKRVKLLPHEPYFQPSYINTLNGDIKRIFEPLENTFVESIVLRKTLAFLTQTYNSILNESIDWNIRLHPYRIIASEKTQGQPTPEGLHRDGVTFIASILINRKNVEGGVTTITDENEKILQKTQLSEPFDILIADDEKTKHSVSSIKPIDGAESSFRDVLVIAFTKPDDIPYMEKKI